MVTLIVPVLLECLGFFSEYVDDSREGDYVIFGNEIEELEDKH